MADDRQEPGRTAKRSEQEISLGCLLFALFAAVSLFFGLRKLEYNPIAQIIDYYAQIARGEVEITSTFTISQKKGEFTTSSGAVWRGLVCRRGTVQDLEYVDVSPVPGELTDLLVQKRFQCDDQSGYFIMYLDVDILEDGTSGTWEIVGGVGDYQDLIGSGAFEGVYEDQSQSVILDTYTGVLEKRSDD